MIITGKPWVILGLWVLLYWSAVPSAHSTAINITELSSRCDRSISRQARQILKQYIFNHVKDRLDHLPDSCPLKPGLDVFAAHEAHKAKKNKAHHKCTYCSKVFKSEHYLDLHLQRKHVHEIPEAATSCLADWCDVLQCDWFQLYHTIQTSKASPAKRREKLLSAGARCMPHVATRTRQRCEEIAHKCFPIEQAGLGHKHDLKDPSAHHWDTAHEFFMHSMCQAATCNVDQKVELLASVVDASRSYGRAAAVAVVLVVLLAMFYVAMCICWSGSKQHDPRQADPSGKNKRVQARPQSNLGSRGYGSVAAPVGGLGTGSNRPSASSYNPAAGQGSYAPAAAAHVVHSANAHHAAPLHQRGAGGPGLQGGAGLLPLGGGPPTAAQSVPPGSPSAGGFTGDALYRHKPRSAVGTVPGLGLWGQAQAQHPPAKAD